MNEKCIESCNPKRDMSGLQMKHRMDLADLPRFPLDDFLNKMTADERKTIMAIYTAKIVDHLKGIENVPESKRNITYRRNPNNSNGRPLPPHLKIEDIFTLPAKDPADSQTGEEH